MAHLSGWQEIRVVTDAGEIISTSALSGEETRDELTSKIAVMQSIMNTLHKDLTIAKERLRDHMDAIGVNTIVSNVPPGDVSLTSASSLASPPTLPTSTPNPTGSLMPTRPLVAQSKDLAVRYNPESLDKIMEFELVPIDILTQSGALVPAHEKRTLVPRKWYIAPLRRLAEKFPEIVSVIESARVVGKRDIVIR